MTRFVLWLLLCSTALGARAAELSAPLVFTGMCDASAAVALAGDLFAVVNDEDNVLRFYRLSQPGAPVHRYDLKPILFSRKKAPEADLEGAARLGDHVFFITSHGRSAQGKPAPNRHRLFALELKQRGRDIIVEPVGKVYTNLVADMSREPKLAKFHLAQAAELAPKAKGGFNIEALTDTPQGTLLIGFRNPTPDHRALVVPLLNPNAVLAGNAPEFGDPILLDLGGLGLRGIGSTGRGYYLMAGPVDSEADCRLFLWSGDASRPQPIKGVQFPGINLEGICFHDVTGKSDFLVLSDDGTRKVAGQECKSLPESQRQFRAYRLIP